jgi:hypothetical protein
MVAASLERRRSSSSWAKAARSDKQVPAAVPARVDGAVLEGGSRGDEACGDGPGLRCTGIPGEALEEALEVLEEVLEEALEEALEEEGEVASWGEEKKGGRIASDEALDGLSEQDEESPEHDSL